MIKKITGLFGAILLLAGCNEQYSYDYLSTHPLILKKAVAVCEQKESPNNDYCETVMRAAANVVSVLNEQQDDPQKFGENLLSAEAIEAKTKSQLVAATIHLAEVKSVQGDIQAAEKQYQMALQAYETQAKKVKLFLAVLSMHSPE